MIEQTMPRASTHAFGLRLKPLQVAGFPAPVALRSGSLTLGRSADNDVTLPGEVFPSVSHFHARVEAEGEHLWVEDLQSRNGTFVNGERISRARVGAGDVIQLGSIGPRFVVISGSPLSETMFVDPAKVGLGGRPAEKVEDIRRALGVPEDLGVEELVERGTRRMQLVALSLSLGVVSILGVWIWNLWIEGKAGQDELTRSVQFGQQEYTRELAEVRHDYESRLSELRDENQLLARLVQELQATEADRHRELSLVRTSFEGERVRLDQDRQALQQRLQHLEANGDTSSKQFAALQEQLGSALSNLALLDPVNLEQARLSEVRQMRSTVLLLEVRLMLENVATGKRLYLADEGVAQVPNFEGIGEPWMIESTGSGFCVSEEGWIITNAHVVQPPSDDPMLTAAGELAIRPVMEIKAVFSGTSERHDAQVVRVANTDGADLALVKIEGFDGIPHIEDFRLDRKPLQPGSDVFLFGFPLGNYALQQGETVIASTFRGILSRVVDGYLQVDAGVHPGNSGGPVTDDRGHVVGVVFSVQALPDQSAVYTIGYAIPLSAVSAIWPPPADWDE